jgi:type VI secretion system secreted protein VgrG
MMTESDVLLPVDYRLDFEGGGSAWLVRKIEVREALSGDFTANVEIENDDATADPVELLGISATLALSRATPELLERTFSGIVRVVTEPWGLDLAGRRRCAIIIEPAFACLKEETLTRKFQDVTVPDVLRAVLEPFAKKFNRKFELRLSREAETQSSGRCFATRDLCVQYGEMTFDFLRRIMAEEGLTYFFEQAGEREQLVVVDSNSGFDTARAPYPLRPPHGGQTRSEAVHTLILAHGRSARRAEMRAFNTTQHRTVAEAFPKRDGGSGAEHGGAEIYRVGAPVTLFGYKEDAYRYDDAATQARLAVERDGVGAVAGGGTSDVIAFRPGLVFLLESDDSELQLAAGKYLVVSVRHRGENPERLADGAEEALPYANELELVPADVTFRPPLVPKPVAIEDWGIVVSGIEGDPIHTDPHGRVRVRFGYDREESVPAERRSPFIPVSQAWAGPGYGVQIIPRAGMLVRLRYLFGDPDRPFVAGCLPTGTNVLPSRPTEEKTRLTIRTRSLRDGGDDLEHFNEITLDDAAEHEQVFIRAGRDYRRKVLNDERVEIDHNEQRVVGHDQVLEVKGTREKTVHQDEAILVKKKRSTNIQGDDDRHVHGKDSLTVEKDQTSTVGGKRSTNVKDLDSGTFMAGRTESVKGDDKLHVSQKLTTIADEEWRAVQGLTELVLKDGDATLKAGGDITLRVKGARLKMDANGKAVLECNEKISLECGEASIVMSPDKIEVAAPEVQLSGTNGSVKLDRGGVTTTGLNVSSTAMASNEITGAFVKAN